MKRFGKKIAAVVLAMALMVAMAVPAFAANSPVNGNWPLGEPLHILTNANGRNECLNAFASSTITAGTQVTTFQDKTAYDASHAFRYVRNPNTGGFAMTCDLNSSYYVGRSGAGYVEFQSPGRQSSAYTNRGNAIFNIVFMKNYGDTTGYYLKRAADLPTGYANSYRCLFDSVLSNNANTQWYVLTYYY